MLLRQKYVSSWSLVKWFYRECTTLALFCYHIIFRWVDFASEKCLFVLNWLNIFLVTSNLTMKCFTPKPAELCHFPLKIIVQLGIHKASVIKFNGQQVLFDKTVYQRPKMVKWTDWSSQRERCPEFAQKCQISQITNLIE